MGCGLYVQLVSLGQMGCQRGPGRGSYGGAVQEWAVEGMWAGRGVLPLTVPARVPQRQVSRTSCSARDAEGHC